MNEKTNERISILKLNTWVSGEVIAKKLNISRTAVWKYIQQLRRKGFTINAKPHLGYHLEKTPAGVTIEELSQQLNTTLFGIQLIHLDSVPSTNDYAKDLAKRNEAEGTIVFADEQIKGRGRKQRPWASPREGLWFSIILRPNIPPTEAMKVTMCAACAIAESIRKHTTLQASIKWPNDVLINNKKVCGILTELSAEIDTINYVIIGIGININNMIPSDLDKIATSLKQELDQDIQVLPLFVSIIESFERFYHSLDEDDTIIRKSWVSYSSTIGSDIKVQTEKGELTGTAIGIKKKW